MKVIIAGGSGFLGKELSQFFQKDNHDVVIFTRGKSQIKDGIQYIQWDGSNLGDWNKELEQSEVLINLTGKSVDCRYTEENKKEIIRSRVESTRILGKAIEAMENPPSLWINASTATIYSHSEDKIMDEENGEIGSDFSMDVAKKWEGAFYESMTPKTRKVALRVSLVIGKSGGVYPVLRKLAKFGLAGTMGKGTQRFSWIHIKDVLRIVAFIIANDEIVGPVNCTAPNPPMNKEFMRNLRQSLHIPIGIPQPTFLLRIGGLIIGTETELILKSRYVSPKKLIDHGFEFEFPDSKKGLEEIAEK